MEERRATCACGALVLTCAGEPVRVSVCHCLECQRRTGSVFGAQARFPRASVRIEGEASRFVRISDSGNPIAFHFCARCGSTVYWELHGLPEFLVVALGAFADPAFGPPALSIYEARRHPWVTFDAATPIEHMD